MTTKHLSIARKELSRTETQGGKQVGIHEHIVNIIIRFEFDEGVLTDLEYIFQDWEYSNEHGVHCHEENEIELIDVNECLQEIEDRIEQDETPDKEDSQREILIKKYLEQFRGFTIWI